MFEVRKRIVCILFAFAIAFCSVFAFFKPSDISAFADDSTTNGADNELDYLGIYPYSISLLYAGYMSNRTYQIPWSIPQSYGNQIFRMSTSPSVSNSKIVTYSIDLNRSSNQYGCYYRGTLSAPYPQAVGDGTFTCQFAHVAPFFKCSLPILSPSELSSQLSFYPTFSFYKLPAFVSASSFPNSFFEQIPFSDLSCTVYYTKDGSPVTRDYLTFYDFYSDYVVYQRYTDTSYLLFELTNIEDNIKTNSTDPTLATTFAFELSIRLRYVDILSAIAALSTSSSEISFDYYYNQGYASGKTDGYSSGYSEGETKGYESGQMDGYEAGFVDGKREGIETVDGGFFSDMIFSVVTSPIDMVLAAFDFDVWGFNLRAVVVGLFSIVVLAALLKRVM